MFSSIFRYIIWLFVAMLQVMRGWLAALLIGCVAGCSAQAHSAGPALGALGAGTARITVNDQELGQTDAVRCLVTPPLLTIVTGDANSGSTTVVSSDGLLAAESVQIRNLDGFTGSYNANLMGHGQVKITESTYSITGDADGFSTGNDSLPANRTFSIKVAC
jgi:ipoprotein LpqH